jgi:hypothetical protein
VTEELVAPKPNGLMGMGPLYSVLHGLRRHMQRGGYRLENVFDRSKPDETLTPGETLTRDDTSVPDEMSTAERTTRQHMHEAAWSDADEALGQALQDIPVFTRAIEALQHASTSDVDSLVKRTSAAAKLVLQSVRHAGRKRELTLAMEPGTETNFDPALHRSDDTPQPGDRVRIRKAPVIRGPAESKVVVLLGEVDPI